MCPTKVGTTSMIASKHFFLPLFGYMPLFEHHHNLV
jgi:hypothetical protein